jgi:N-acetyl-anhydromuramyl-L-alanine amidase AmpD
MSGPIVARMDNALWHGGDRSTDAISLLVWHTTRGTDSFRDSMHYLNTTNDKKASYHYGIERTGEIIRMLPVEKVAWACGDSDWPHPIPGNGTEECRPNGGKSVNAISISCAWANDDSQKLTVQQLASGLYLAKIYWARCGIPVSLNLGHREVSPNRKVDPNPQAFSMDDWRRQISNYIDGQ